jgi:hypothetical protein
MADDDIERQLSARLRAELDHVSGPRPTWSNEEAAMGDSRPVRSKSNRFGWILSGAAVAIVVAVLLVTQLPHGGPAGTGPSASSPPSLGEHQVATDQGIVSFDIENDVFVIRLTAAGVTTELGRTSTVVQGASGFAMVCGPADGPDSHRYVFGFLEEGRAIQYTGPSAVGQGTADGAFLFAIQPGSIGTQELIKVGPPKDAGGGSVGFPGNAFATAISSGVRQASGCYILD